MKTKNIFIDTQAFMRQGFKFENRVLSGISRLGRSGAIKIYISDVVKGEVHQKIQEKLEKSITHKNAFLRELSVLESSVPDTLLQEVGEQLNDKLLELARQRWSSYICESNIQVLDSNKINVSDLLSDYFSGSFPFSEGKKKNEFPDAISLLSLVSWLDNNSEKAYVVSDDGDFKGFCEANDRCLAIGELSEFLDIYNRSEERLAEIIHRYIETHRIWLALRISDEFVNADFLYGQNFDANVDEVSVISLDISDVEIIDIQDSVCTIELTIDVEMVADVNGPDYSNSFWDSEEQVFTYVEMFDKTMDFEVATVVTLELSFDEKEARLTNVSDVVFNRGKSVGLYFDDGFPYK